MFQSFHSINKNQLGMWDIAMFANGTIGGSGYNFNITFFNESEINVVDDPCTSPFGHHLICMTEWENDSTIRIDNGIIVTDKWILTSATACLNIYNNVWNDYFVRAGALNLTEFENGSIIKNYHIFLKENQDRDKECNQNDDYCMIELETPLVVSESIKAIGFQHFPSDYNKNSEPIMPTIPSSGSAFDKCWIAAWSDNNLRTFKVEIENNCYSYYPSDHISFRNKKISAKQKTGQKMKVNESSGDEKPMKPITDEIIGVTRDDIMNPEGVDYYGRRTHICIENLRSVCIQLDSYFHIVINSV